MKSDTYADLYAILDVARDVDEAAIRKAYRKAAKTAHPDAGGSDAAMHQLSTAFAVLTDPARRKAYDDTGEITESRPDTDRPAALGIIQSYLGAIVSQYLESDMNAQLDPRQIDMVAAIRSRIVLDLSKAKAAIPGGERVIVFYDDFMKRFELKNPEVDTEDPIRRGIEHQIKETQRQMDSIRTAIRVNELALAIIDGYEFTADQHVMALHTGTTWGGVTASAWWTNT